MKYTFQFDINQTKRLQIIPRKNRGFVKLSFLIRVIFAQEKNMIDNT